MTTQTYGLSAGRINTILGETLAHAIPVEVLSITGDNFNMDKRKGDTVIFRRWLPRGATTTNSTAINTITADPTSFQTAEGVTPDADTIAPQDISVQLQQYSVLYMYTDKTAMLYEDDIPMEMKTQTGETMGLVREMIRYGALKGCTNVFYAGGTTRATTDEAIGLPILRRVAKSIAGNRGKRITRVLASTADFNTASVEAGYVVFVHTDAAPDIRDLPGFIPVASYGPHKSPLHEQELGSCEEFRFIVSPELAPITNTGATAAGTGLVTSSSLVDIYPFIVVAQNAWGDVALRGMRSFNLRVIPHTTIDKSDPLGQRGYVGATFWSAMFVQNDGWMAKIEAGVTDV